MCFGRQVVLEALQSGNDMERIFLRRGLTGKAILEIESIASQQGIPVNKVPKEKLNRLTNLNHQGIVALLSPIQFFQVEDVVDRCFSAGKDPLIVILDGITDVGNFGAICRSALGLEVDAVVIGHFRAASVNAQAIKSSAGAIHHLRMCRHRDLPKVVEFLKDSGIQVIAMDGASGNFFHDLNLKGPMALILGSEGEGVSRELLKLADASAKLPLNEKLESYNVSVAGAMALYEIRRTGS